MSLERALICFGSAAWAGTLTAQSTIRGIVREQSGRVIAGAEVSVPTAQRTTRTDSTGAYRLTVPAGRHWLGVRAIGFQRAGDSISVPPDVGVIRNVILAPTAVALDTISIVGRTYVSAGLQGFEERRKHGNGHFITEDVMRTYDNRKMSDLLRRVPGLRVIPGRGGADYAGMMRGTGNCVATIYLDGLVLYDRGMPLVDLRTLPPNTMATAEFYSSSMTAPPEFRNRGGCGLLLLWTRER